MLDRETHNYKWGIVATVSLFSIFLFYLNILVPYLPGDDFIFQLKLPEKGILGDQKISSFSDLFQSQVNFYNNYHYRIFNHTILQVLLLCPSWVFDLLNTIAFLALPYCLLRIRKVPDTMTYATHYLILLFFIWIFHFNLGRSYFLTTGALNYTWLLIPLILYLVELFRISEGEGNTKWLVLLAFANAMSNENAMLVLFALTAIVALSKHKENFVPLVWCLAIFLSGIIFMLSSPSIALRLEEQGFRETTTVSHLREYLLRSAYYLLRYLPIALLYYIIRKPNATPKIEHIHSRFIKFVSTKNLLLTAIFISFSSMAFVPLFEPRSAILGFFLTILFVLTLGQIKRPTYPSVVIIVVLAIIIAVIRYPAFLQINLRHRMNTTILKAQQDKNVVAKLNNYCDDKKRSYLLCHEISADSTYMDNKTLANYYDIQAVVLQDKSKLKQRRQRTFNLIRKKAIDYTHFRERTINGDAILFNQTKGCEFIMISATEKFYIIRGARSGLNLHRFVELLPCLLYTSPSPRDS